MAKKTKKTAPKKTKKTEKKILKVKNYVFEVFTGRNPVHSTSIAKLKMNLSGKTALKHHRYVQSIIDSVEAKAYFGRRDELIKDFEEKQKKLDEKKRKPTMPANIPEWEKALEMESGLEVEMFEIDMDTFPEFKDPERIVNGIDVEVLENYYDIID